MKVLQVCWTVKPELWWTVTVLVIVTMVVNVTSLSGPNVCMVKQKYNITKRVKYRAPMSVRTYEWCFAMPPRCSKWNTEMRDVTKLETEERTAEMAVCCPGYKLKDVSCVPTCPSGKTGQGCSEDCPSNKWGPSCAHDCKKCVHGECDSVTGECRCQHGWQGESCETSMTTTAAAALMEQLLTTETASTKTSSKPTVTTRSSTVATTATTRSTSSLATKLTHTQASSSSTTTEITQMTIPIKSISIATLSTTEKHELITLTTPKGSVTLTNTSISPTSINTVTNYRIGTGGTTKAINKLSVKLTSSYNRTEVPRETVIILPTEKEKSSTQATTMNVDIETNVVPTTSNTNTEANLATQIPKTSTAITIMSTYSPATKKLATTVRQPLTTKLKPKEIWIKPAQKGESTLIEAKLKPTQELPHSKLKYKEVSEITTPKTIIVSIIPTSVTYVTFRKIALTTAVSMAQKSNFSSVSTITKAPVQDSTKSMTIKTTSSPFTVKVSSRTSNIPSTNTTIILRNVTKSSTYTSSTRRTYETTPVKQTSNSMTSTLNVANKRLNSSLLTTVASFVTNSRKEHSLSETSTNNINMTRQFESHTSPVTEKLSVEQNTAYKHFHTHRNVTSTVTEPPIITKMVNNNQAVTSNKANITLFNNISKNVTEHPLKDEETFHILTEPEHITAVMGDKGRETSTINLISVISIAGGVMMAIITVAVVIVMLERCRKPRYEDVRKYNDIRMQVMIDKNDDPPPYVRSIFHTPLPEPPTSEKCHYQPISTLDRNLKQFMRPVVVQTISPLMLENFRGILECHYDHLPRRSQDIQSRCSVAPSIDERAELLAPPRIHSLTDSDIEAMKCEAKLDVIDNTTSEPLYAEIPCWRPPSAHAIEVVNLNGEAVTEL